MDKSGDIKLKYIPWEFPFKYEPCSPTDPDVEPTYKSWDGQSIKKVQASYPNRYSIYEFIDALPEEEKEELFEYNEPNIYFCDIETEITDGFPEASEATNRVLSISVVYDDKIILMGLEDMDDAMQKRITDNTNKYFEKFGTKYEFKYLKYDEEFDMMYTFFHKMIPQMPLITGWNFVNYDWIYLVNRSRKLEKNVNGRVYKIDPRVSSLTKKLDKAWMGDEEIPAHRMIMDYMALYAGLDTSVKVKESNSLDFVSEKLLGVTKIKYSGSLKALYEDDFETFMYYNCVDSVLVQQIHLKSNYVSIIYAVSALARIKAVDVFNTQKGALASLAITEGVLRNRFREQENIILFKDPNRVKSGSGIAGGWVKEPKTGMNQWVCCYDFASLYPTTQRQFFIAPENYIGKQIKNQPDQCISDFGKKVVIDKDNMVICINGSVFKKNESPTINMLKDVYEDRKRNKKIMMDKRFELDLLYKELEQVKNIIV